MAELIFSLLLLVLYLTFYFYNFFERLKHFPPILDLLGQIGHAYHKLSIPSNTKANKPYFKCLWLLKYMSHCLILFTHHKYF